MGRPATSRNRNAARNWSLRAPLVVLPLVATLGCARENVGAVDVDSAKATPAGLAGAFADCGEQAAGVSDTVEAVQTEVSCEADEFADYLQVAELGELRELDPATALAYVRGLCLYSAAVAQDASVGEIDIEALVKSTAASWDVDESVVREALQAAEVLCPDDSTAVGVDTPKKGDA